MSVKKKIKIVELMVNCPKILSLSQPSSNLDLRYWENLRYMFFTHS
jgi:ABC-type Na+ transport system ATPase subunit NatA